MEQEKTIEFDSKIDKYFYNSKYILGEGQFGKVVLGYNEQSQELVAIKCMSIQKIKESVQFVKLLKREIEIMQKIEHENIIRLYDVIQTENNIHMVLEYCEEGDLGKYLEKHKGVIPFEESYNFFIQILKGFEVLYNNNIIHRDIKPANILMKNNKVLISDFGFAKIIEAEQKDSILNLTLLGSPLYSSPQILRGDQFSNKCDIWSVGIMTYQLIYGRVPWIGVSKEELYLNMMNKDLTFPKQPKIPSEFKQLLKQMLKLEDQDRISWPEIFNSQLFLFPQTLFQKESQEQENQQILNHLESNYLQYQNNIAQQSLININQQQHFMPLDPNLSESNLQISEEGNHHQTL